MGNPRLVLELLVLALNGHAPFLCVRCSIYLEPLFPSFIFGYNFYLLQVSSHTPAVLMSRLRMVGLACSVSVLVWELSQRLNLPASGPAGYLALTWTQR